MPALLPGFSSPCSEGTEELVVVPTDDDGVQDDDALVRTWTGRERASFTATAAYERALEPGRWLVGVGAPTTPSSCR